MLFTVPVKKDPLFLGKTMSMELLLQFACGRGLLVSCSFLGGRERVNCFVEGFFFSDCSVLCPGGMTCEQTKDKNRRGNGSV